MADGSFAAQVKLFTDNAKDKKRVFIRSVGLKILGRLVELSPVGDPKRWEINEAFAAADKEAKATNTANRQANANGRLKKGQKVTAAVRIVYATKIGPVTYMQKGWAAKNYVGGRFRGNWQVSFNAKPEGVLDTIDRDGSATISRGRQVLSEFNNGVSSIYFTNNLPYARRLEYGWSQQAPGGMVRITLKEIQQFVRAAAGEAKK